MAVLCLCQHQCFAMYVIGGLALCDRCVNHYVTPDAPEPIFRSWNHTVQTMNDEIWSEACARERELIEWRKAHVVVE